LDPKKTRERTRYLADEDKKEAMESIVGTEETDENSEARGRRRAKNVILRGKTEYSELTGD